MPTVRHATTRWRLLAALAAVVLVPAGLLAATTARPATASAAPTAAAAAAAAGPITGASVGIAQTWNNASLGKPSGTGGGPTSGDTWYNTWAADGNIYATSDDASGFAGTCQSNFSVNELNGDTAAGLASPYENCMTGYGTPGNRQGYNDGRTWKTDGIISVDGTLYVVVTRQDDGFGGYPVGFQPSNDASIIKSTDNGRTWSNSFGVTDDPKGAAPPPLPGGQPGAEAMFPGTSFPTPEFIQYGQDDNPASTADGGNTYVYAISNDGFAYNGNYYILGRVLRSQIGDLSAADWQFYTGPPGGNGMDSANWSSDSAKATHILSAAHQLSQASIIYDAPLHTYILASAYFPFTSSWSGAGAAATSTWNFFEAPHPWGPWTRFFNRSSTECYFGCQPSSESTLGWYDPALVSKFITMDGLGNTVLTAEDFGTGGRSNDWLYKLHAFPFTLSTRSGQVVDDSVAFPPGTTGTGAWTDDYADGGYLGDTDHYSDTPGSSLSYTFTGNAIAWVGSRNTNHGYASVSIDGGPPTLVNTYAAQQEKQQVLFAENDLSSGKHTITITVTSEKEAAATGTSTDIDAFIVGGSGQSAPIQVSPASPYMGAWPDSATLAPGASAKETIELDNAGGATPLTVSWNASIPGGAVTVSPSSGTLTAAAGQVVTATVTLSAPQSAPQTVATMTVSATASNGSPVIPVSLPVTIAPPGSIVRAYNDVGIVNDSSPLSSGGFDGSGTSYSAQALATASLTPGATVTHDGLTFTWPNVPAGLPDNVITDGQTITVSGSGGTLGFLGATHNGGASGTGAITYTDGSTQQFTLAMSDWWSNASPPGGDILASVPYIVAASGPETQKVSIYYDGVALQPGKTVQSITLPNVSSMHIFAVTIG